MNFKEIKDLVKLIDQLGLTEFKMKDGEFEISVRTKNYEKVKQQLTAVPMPTQQQMVQMPTAIPAPQPAPLPQAPHADSTSAPATSQGQDSATGPDDESKYQAIKSPIVGTFYRSPSPEKGAYVKVGDTVSTGDVVCMVEAMKLFNEIESEISGKIVKVMVEDAQPVEYDQVLFLVDPNG
ncbi:MAG: acetyl-CoA carboxylase biotin carboxyl carrier protein [Saprospiraceae bacterium]|nr:acetyl-CoA carboxylase biotin carboxyl carrier protein [Saprospiraceae bacterium]